jgi:hypothetical protein
VKGFAAIAKTLDFCDAQICNGLWQEWRVLEPTGRWFRHHLAATRSWNGSTRSVLWFEPLYFPYRPRETLSLWLFKVNLKYKSVIRRWKASRPSQRLDFCDAQIYNGSWQEWRVLEPTGRWFRRHLPATRSWKGSTRSVLWFEPLYFPYRPRDF